MGWATKWTSYCDETTRYWLLRSSKNRIPPNFIVDHQLAMTWIICHSVWNILPWNNCDTAGYLPLFIVPYLDYIGLSQLDCAIQHLLHGFLQCSSSVWPWTMSFWVPPFLIRTLPSGRKALRHHLHLGTSTRGHWMDDISWYIITHRIHVWYISG